MGTRKKTIFKFNEDGNPEYCLHISYGSSDCYFKRTPLNLTYKGKYFRKECTYCWRNSLVKARERKKYSHYERIKAIRNTTSSSCPVCEKEFKGGELAINVGFKGRHNLVCLKCYTKFVDNLAKFREEKLQNVLIRDVAESI